MISSHPRVCNLIYETHKVELLRDIAAGEIVQWSDVLMPDSEGVRARRDMERRFAPAPAAIAAQ